MFDSLFQVNDRIYLQINACCKIAHSSKTFCYQNILSNT